MKNSTSTPLARPTPSPALDGIEHINVHYTFSTTKLGKMLSTYFVAKFTHPYLGQFKCIEGLMLYLRTGCQDEAFREMTGSEAMSYYRNKRRWQQLSNHDIPREADVFFDAYYARLSQYPVAAVLFNESTLPFDVYYLIGERRDKPIRPRESMALVDALTRLRELMKRGETPTLLSQAFYEQLRKT
jgi:hypothetical protein